MSETLVYYFREILDAKWHWLPQQDKVNSVISFILQPLNPPGMKAEWAPELEKNPCPLPEFQLKFQVHSPSLFLTQLIWSIINFSWALLEKSPITQLL
jgi:hypothetical protein